MGVKHSKNLNDREIPVTYTFETIRIRYINFALPGVQLLN